MGLKLVTPASTEPVTLAEAKAHLRVDVPDDDALITALIAAARLHAENVCRRSFVTQGYVLALDQFPSTRHYSVAPGYLAVDQSPSAWSFQRSYSVRFRGTRIDLPFPRLQGVSSVTYIDPAGLTQTLAPTEYLVDDISEPGCIAPAVNKEWPDTQDRLNAVQIAFTAGYGNAAAVPAGIKSWILLRVGALYENREEVLVGTRLVVAELPFVDRLLDPYRMASYV